MFVPSNILEFIKNKFIETCREFKSAHYPTKAAGLFYTPAHDFERANELIKSLQDSKTLEAIFELIGKF